MRRDVEVYSVCRRLLVPERVMAVDRVGEWV